ncbi:MAG: hypothetical protein MR514_04815 [Succinivibrio sp.]|nr:hypothetical protein [Succinivibrio sp.]
MSYQQLTPELTQRIINEAVNSNLSSYQIAFKYSITKSVGNCKFVTLKVSESIL